MNDTKKKRMPKTPWDTATIRQTARRMMDRVGGPIGWEAIGQTFRAAMIDAAAFGMFQTAAACRDAEIKVSHADMMSTRRAIEIASGDVDR